MARFSCARLPAGEVPTAGCAAGAPAADALFRVRPLYLGEAQADLVQDAAAFTHHLVHVGQHYVLQLDLVVLDPLAVAVGSHEFELGLGDRLARRAVLHQDRRGEIYELGEAQCAMLGVTDGVAASGGHGRAPGLRHAPVGRRDLDPAQVAGIGRLSLDAIDLQVCISCHDVVSWW